MSFPKLSNTNIKFLLGKPTWKTYTITEALSIAGKIEMIDKDQFPKAALDKNFETFLLYDSILKVMEPVIHLSWTLVSAALQQQKIPIKISLEYAEYADICAADLAMKLHENINMNKYAIELFEGKQPLYGSIHSLGPVALETLKAHIETYQKTGFV